MRIAALADIHSNVYALSAVIEDALKRDAGALLNLGDILYGPIAPRATYDLLARHEFVTVSGNQDREIWQATDADLEANPTLRFTLDDLQDSAVNWLKTLPFDRQFNEDIYMCHGTPADDQVYLLENVDSGFCQIRTDREIAAQLGGQSSKVVLCGHSHVPRAVALGSGQLVINPGSVGLPAYTDEEPRRHSMETFSPHAAYAIIEKCGVGWTVQHIKVPYDHQAAAKEALKRHREDWAHSLTTGRARGEAI